MRRRIVAKGNVRRGDAARAIVTDTLPEEVPVIFSNDGFYLNFTRNTPNNPEAALFVQSILDGQKAYTKPFRYSILKDSWSVRRLSLIHPAAQLQVATFYSQFDTLLCHYTSKSINSLRAPSKVGSTYFVRGTTSDSQRYRQSGVETVTLETTTSNPASYFAYNRYSRVHQFFDSNEYLHLEKRFRLFRTLDVSACFSSIYTHTLFWATADVETAKDNVKAAGYANSFDRLMQSMNYNETNGICIGPEISRIFAENIFAEIDKRTVDRLTAAGYVYKVDYEFRRYVDDFYVFAQSIPIIEAVTAEISHSLLDFNLTLNERKMVTLERPFATKISRIIADANTTLTEFFGKFLLLSRNEDHEYLIPKRIRKSDALIRSFTNSVKSICANHQTGYDTVSDYIVSAISRRVSDLADTYAYRPYAEDRDLDDDIDSYMLLIETMYFFYTVNPTVRSSLSVARAVIIAARWVREHRMERSPHLTENVVRWTLDLARSIQRDSRHQTLAAVPIEVLNIIIPMHEVADGESLVDTLIEEVCKDLNIFGYFEIVTFIFLCKSSIRHRSLLELLFKRGQDIVADGLGPRIDSQSAHLCLDLLACPYISLERRSTWFNTLRGRCGLPAILRADAQEAVTAIEDHPWFIRWREIDLLAMLRKKELSDVY